MKSPIAVFDAPRFESLPGDIQAVIEAIATETQHPVHALLGKRRSADLVIARAKLALELRSHGLSLPQIGTILNRDHSTIVYHLRLANKTPEGQKQEPVQITFIAEPTPEPEPKPKKEKRTPKEQRMAKARDLAQTMELPRSLDSEFFRSSLADWLEYKEKRNELYVGPGLTALINKFSRWGAQRSKEAIDNSMANGYQGVFEERGRPPKPQTSTIIDICAEAYDNSRDS